MHPNPKSIHTHTLIHIDTGKKIRATKYVRQIFICTRTSIVSWEHNVKKTTSFLAFDKSSWQTVWLIN